jgi:hypothetical protein
MKKQVELNNPAVPVPLVSGLDISIQVTRADGMWVAESDILHLVTEADTYDALIERAMLIAPELAELNGVGVGASHLRLHFEYAETVPSHSLH